MGTVSDVSREYEAYISPESFECIISTGLAPTRPTAGL